MINNLKEAEAKERLTWPDVAKGICIIAVMAGHLRVPQINQFVYLWHLPVFFILSGYFLKIDSNRNFVHRKASRLLVPYYLTCIAVCIFGFIRAIIEHEDAMYVLASWVFASLYGAGDTWRTPFLIYGIGAIWFLWALFIATVIVNTFAKLKYDYVIILLIAILGWTSFEYLKIWFPLSIQAGMLTSLYVFIGFKAKELNLHIERPGIIFFISSLVVSVWGIYNFNGFWLVHDYMGNGWIDFSISICASIVVFAISNIIANYTNVLKKILCFFGSNSLVILCLHLIELDVIKIRDIIESYINELSIVLDDKTVVFSIFLVRLIYVVIGTILLKKVKIINLIFT